MSDSPVRIRLKPHGTLVVEGPIEILDNDGNPVSLPPAKTPGVTKLCGCGHSKAWPFCDSSHKETPRGG